MPLKGPPFTPDVGVKYAKRAQLGVTDISVAGPGVTVMTKRGGSFSPPKL